MKYKFDCGCEIDILEDKVKEYDGLPSLYIDYENLGLNCPKVWNLYASGKTRGVFQLETQLGAGWSKELEPESLGEIAALLSILRPGCLKSSLDGKSMTKHYVDRKHGEQYTDIDPSISDIMFETHGILVYQEQSMKIAQRIAGFDLKQSDNLRKGIGKKRADILAAIRKEFVDGCINTKVVTEETANIIYDIIEKSNRYSFNACLSPDTVVETENGLKTIDDLKIGDKVLDHNNNYVDVLNIYDNGNKELFEITLESGKTIKCTLDHEFLCDDNKKHKLSEILEKNLSIMCEESV